MMVSAPTYYLSLVLVKLDFGKGLDKDLDKHNGILVAGPDTLHEPRITYALFIANILQLRNIYTGGACRRRR